MANAIYEQMRELALGAGLDWASQDYRAALVKLDTADGFGLAITNATNATPIVCTVAVAPPTGSVVSIKNVLGNLAASSPIVILLSASFDLATLIKPFPRDGEARGTYCQRGNILIEYARK